MFCHWLIMWLLSAWIIVFVVHSYLMMKSQFHPSFITTTTCRAKTCKHAFSLSHNSVPVMEIWFSHTKQTMQAVALCCDVCCIQCPLGGSRSKFAETTCGLIVIPALCWEYLFIVLNTAWRQDENAATDSMAEACAVPCHSACARLWNADADPAVCAFRWSSPVLFVDTGFFTARLSMCNSSKWPWRFATGVMFTVEVKMILLEKAGK